MAKGGMGNIMKQAQMMQANLQKAQAELANIDVEGAAGNGLIKITISCKHEIKKIDILIPIKLHFAYKDLSKVMRIIKKYQLILKSQQLEIACEVLILAKKINLKTVISTFEAFHEIKVEILND